MRVFLAGIMQGSLVHHGVHEQDYRQELANLLRQHVPGVEIFDPWAAYPGSLDYDELRIREVLVANIEEAARSDLVVAFLPQASMGTALEMWEAWRAGVPVVAVTPLAANWVVRVCASQRFASLEEFADVVRRGQLPALGITQ